MAEIPEAAVEAVFTRRYLPGASPIVERALREAARNDLTAALPAIHAARDADLRERLVRPAEDALGQLRRIGEGRDFSVSDSALLADRLRIAIDSLGQEKPPKTYRCQQCGATWIEGERSIESIEACDGHGPSELITDSIGLNEEEADRG